MKYFRPEIEVIEFEVEDVITTSNLIDGGETNEKGEFESPVMPTSVKSMMD